MGCSVFLCVRRDSTKVMGFWVRMRPVHFVNKGLKLVETENLIQTVIPMKEGRKKRGASFKTSLSGQFSSQDRQSWAFALTLYKPHNLKRWICPHIMIPDSLHMELHMITFQHIMESPRFYLLLLSLRFYRFFIISPPNMDFTVRQTLMSHNVGHLHMYNPLHSIYGTSIFVTCTFRHVIPAEHSP